MEEYLEEIKNKGLETLEKFLLLLKEDMLLFHTREKQVPLLTEEEKELFYISNKESKKDNDSGEIEKIVSREKFNQYEEKLARFKKFSKSKYLASNAHFIYLFALLDQFLLEIAKIAIKNNEEIMKNYKNYCVSYFESQKDKNLYKILPFEDKLIDYLSNFSNPITVITEILEIDFKKGIKQSEHYFNFIEMKERRNYLVHRSGICDEMFFKTIKKYLSKFPQKRVNNFVDKLKDEKIKSFDIDVEYFLRTIRTFYFLVSLIVSKAITKNKTKKIDLFADQFNDLLIYSLDNECGLPLLVTPLDLFRLYKSEYLENKLSKMHDQDKVNWILCSDKCKEIFELIYNDDETTTTEKEKIEEKNFKSNVLKAIKECDEEINSLLKEIEDPLIKEIINSFLAKNYQKFIEKIFIIAKEKRIRLKEIETKWYLYKKLSEDIKFKKIYSSYKQKYNHESDELTVVLPTKFNN